MVLTGDASQVSDALEAEHAEETQHGAGNLGRVHHDWTRLWLHQTVSVAFSLRLGFRAPQFRKKTRWGIPVYNRPSTD